MIYERPFYSVSPKSPDGICVSNSCSGAATVVVQKKLLKQMRLIFHKANIQLGGVARYN
jgi:hypothetical protein